MSNSPPPGSSADDTGDTPIRRRSVLAVGGAVVFAGLSGCLSRVASAVTNTGASPASVFSGTQGASAGEFVVGEPHVSRLTPTLAERVELDGWITSSPVMAQNHNSSRSNAPGESYVRDADGDGTEDADEDLEPIYEYLGGEAMIAERFTVCLPDAEVPGGNGSIKEAVTPERLLSYLTAGTDAGERVYSWRSPKAGPDETGDCDDDDPTARMGAACGTSPHFVADVTGPVSTDGSLEVVRAEDGAVFLQSGNRASTERLEMQIEMQMTLTADPIVAGPDSDGSDTSCSADDEPCGPGVWARTTESGSSTGVSVYQVMVQPPRCPDPFPALFYLQRCESDGQLVYTGGWVIDDAALYEDSFTVLSMADVVPVVGIDLGDLDSDGDGFSDPVMAKIRRRVVAGRSRRSRGARLDMGPVDELVERGVLSEEGKEANDSFIRKKPGGRRLVEEEGYVLTHLALDAPVLHLVGKEASNEVKFKAGAELSGQVN